MTMQLTDLEGMSAAERRDLLALLLDAGVEPDVSDLKFELLGPLTVKHRGVDFAPSAPKRRALLATLLFNANRPVPSSVLCREIWGEQLPRSAHATLQTYVFSLRTLFRTRLGLSPEYVSQELLYTHMGGYTLRVEPGQLDLDEFEELVAAGTVALQDGDYARAADTLRRSLCLWRGPVVEEEHQWGTYLRGQLARLAERRCYAQVLRIEADLCLGRHHQLISELACLAVERPLDETVQALFMIALYRSGRKSAALDTYLRFRHVMMDELGIGPSARIQALQLALLSADPVLDDRNLTSDMLLDLLTITAPGRR
jgi:DNA-binding SARP family transcriptional activator